MKNIAVLIAIALLALAPALYAQTPTTPTLTPTPTPTATPTTRTLAETQTLWKQAAVYNAEGVAELLQVMNDANMIYSNLTLLKDRYGYNIVVLGDEDAVVEANPLLYETEVMVYQLRLTLRSLDAKAEALSPIFGTLRNGWVPPEQ